MLSLGAAFFVSFGFMIEKKIAIELVELEEDSFHIVTSVELSSGVKGYMIIDTGASKTVFDKSFLGDNIEYLDNESDLQSGGLGGAIEDIQVCTLDYIKIDSFTIDNPSLAVLDMSAINDLYQEHCNKRIAALLGSDFLFKYKAVIDYGKMEMIFHI